ncbi:type II toxin-antitoxin system VapC family toxin [Jiella endophytica]|uniref:Ribonuclease VapC n=1 Tax=Jiella endophytica TaxID=2558362 RepID=A0A4Y8RMS1_9HYPH|nr:type II toxin-antitoxin system VapC family toxin [Jiella endophytica]TFF24942.1 type II toxin-antitoxin system VapC family toxin [Jiella endophytica]
MYLFDTKVVSSLRRPDKLNQRTAQRIAAIPDGKVRISVISVLELELGILSLARKDARQAQILREWFDAKRASLSEAQVLPIDEPVALASAALHVPDRRDRHDALIAATALAHGLTLVTRNVKDFRTIDGLRLLDPWA